MVGPNRRQLLLQRLPLLVGSAAVSEPQQQRQKQTAADRYSHSGQNYQQGNLQGGDMSANQGYNHKRESPAILQPRTLSSRNER